MPTLFVLAGIVFVEIVGLVPTINIKRLESKHFEYEDKVNALNEINLDRENKYNTLKTFLFVIQPFTCISIRILPPREFAQKCSNT